VTLSFRAKIFLSSLGVAAAALVIVTVIVAYERRQDERSSIEMRLVTQAQLIAELLSQSSPISSDQDLDDEADRLGELLQTRVTLIAADGRVLGDSDLEGQALADVENHLQRPEVQQSRAQGVGVVARYSTTVRIEMLYAAVTAHHPQVRYVRGPDAAASRSCSRNLKSRHTADVGQAMPTRLHRTCRTIEPQNT
jgi:two-component system, OmpR family, phosphate regulon sensor histidine kinase PhoR